MGGLGASTGGVAGRGCEADRAVIAGTKTSGAWWPITQRAVRADGVVQHDDGTPTGSRSTSFFIRGILGPDAWSIFMRWLRRQAERFSVAASLVGHPGDGWRFRPGCSIGRPAWPGVLAPLLMLTLRCSPPWQRCCRM